MADSPAVTVQDLRVVRGGKEVLHDVSLSVAAGSVTGLLGPSGCGKTTLMRDRRRPARGRRRRDRARARRWHARAAPARRLRHPGAVGLCRPEHRGEPALLRGGRRRRSRAGRRDDGDRRPGRARRAGRRDALGGERSRVSLATALLGEPELLVLDEPTVGLDPVLRAELWATFHELAAAGGTLLISSHVMDEARECDELLLMRDGALLEETTPAALRERTGEQDLGAAFLATIRAAERSAAP